MHRRTFLTGIVATVGSLALPLNVMPKKRTRNDAGIAHRDAWPPTDATGEDYSRDAIREQLWQSLTQHGLAGDIYDYLNFYGIDVYEDGSLAPRIAKA